MDKYDLDNSKWKTLIAEKAVSAEQIHSAEIAIVGKEKSFYAGVDGLITEKKRLLSIRSADCLPVLFYDPVTSWIAAVHAGWKGLRKLILKDTVAKFSQFGVNPKYLTVAVGPHIGDCCYQVQESRIDLYKHLGKNYLPEKITRKKNGKYYLKLKNIALIQLTSAGVESNNIDFQNECTSCSDQYYSFRREGSKAGRLYSLISKN